MVKGEHKRHIDRLADAPCVVDDTASQRDRISSENKNPGTGVELNLIERQVEIVVGGQINQSGELDGIPVDWNTYVIRPVEHIVPVSIGSIYWKGSATIPYPVGRCPGEPSGGASGRNCEILARQGYW